VNVAIFLAGFLSALLVAAAVFDLATYTIPNAVPGAMIVLFVPFAVAMAMGGHPLSLGDMGFHLLAGLVGLIAGATLFTFGWVGGGDAKLFAATALWLGWDTLLDYAVLSALLGGFLTLGVIFLRRIPLPAILAAMPWLARLANPKQGIPYGVSLAMAALAMWPGTALFRLAATG
jgi:prepilin peptidase CpaA